MAEERQRLRLWLCNSCSRSTMQCCPLCTSSALRARTRRRQVGLPRAVLVQLSAAARMLLHCPHLTRQMCCCLLLLLQLLLLRLASPPSRSASAAAAAVQPSPTPVPALIGACGGCCCLLLLLLLRLSTHVTHTLGGGRTEAANRT